MDATISGYKTDIKIHESRNIWIYRAHRSKDNLPVILKILKPEVATADSLARFSREYAFISRLNSLGIRKAYGLEPYHTSLMMVLEDIPGQPLAQVLREGPLSLPRFLELSIALADILTDVHRAQITHKNINPDNIIVSPTRDQLHLIDFGLAGEMPRNRIRLRPTSAIEGTLPYISPEQTGRMNRLVDYRTDLYSLGVTLYQMLTGRLPFEAADAMALVHCHIASIPPPPHTINHTIPRMVSGIIMKLMAKMAENRYQSAWGLKADLKRCLNNLTGTGQIEEFSLGQEDVPEQFRIPQKLYGREKEIERLLAAIAHAGDGAMEVILVNGYSGAGKTSLAHEAYSPTMEINGFFIEGKWDLLQRNEPYTGWIQAFSGLAQYLLMEDENQLAAWKATILDAVGENGKVLTEIIPALELIIGPQPVVPKMSPAGTQFRFNSAFESLTRAIATEEHPLVLFLDDLQWIDPASLNLLEYLATQPDMKHLLLIGAYRSNGINSTHPLLKTEGSIAKSGANIQSVSLPPLSTEDLNILITDTFNPTPADAAALSGLVFKKTAGNPFFVNQFLSTLYQEGLIVFDSQNRGWRWDISSIEKKGYTDNVAELMISKLRKLTGPTQRQLELAACLGNRFDISELQLISGAGQKETAEALDEALREGLLSQVSTASVYFMHDRIQRAAYSLTPDEQKAELHLRIGRLLLERNSGSKLENRIFDIVGHFNRGAGLLTSRKEKLKIAGLELMAGEKAKTATAFASAAGFYSMGVSLLPGDSWGKAHNLTYSLHAGLAETTFIKGAPDEALQSCEGVLAKAGTNTERIRMYQLKIDILTTKGEPFTALVCGVDCLRMIGIDMPLTPTGEQVRAEEECLKNILHGQNLKKIAELPLAKNPDISAALETLAMMHPASHYVPDPSLYFLIPTVMCKLSLRHGNLPASALSYIVYGSVCAMKFNPSKALLFGKMAYKMVERFNLVAHRPKVYFLMGAVIAPFSESLAVARKHVDKSFKAALEAGDIPFACFARFVHIGQTLLMGTPLDKVYQDSERCINFTRRVKYGMVENMAICEQRLVQALRGQTLHVGSFEDESFSEKVFEERIKSDVHSAACYQTNKLQSSFFAGDYPAALRAIGEVKGRLFLISGETATIRYYFHAALTLAVCRAAADGEEKKTLASLLNDYLKILKVWADNYPPTFQNLYSLARAEAARADGRDLEAMRLYEESIRSARENGFVQNEALAHELAAKFWLSAGYEDFARLHMTKAHRGYQLWQAWGKTRAMEAQYPQWLPAETGRYPAGGAAPHSPGDTSLDTDTMIKATQAISSKIELDRLLATVMKIIIENAGAQEGFLILKKDDHWVIAAQGNGNQSRATGANPVRIDESDALSVSAVNYVARTKERLVLDDAAHQGAFAKEPHIVRQKTKSLLCTPLLSQGRLIGILYLENNLTTHAFTPDRSRLLEVLVAQAAISLENARIYTDLRKREEALRESESKYRRIVDTANEGIWVTDKNLHISFANEMMLQMLGYSREEVIGRDISSFVFKEDMPDHVKKMEARRRGLEEQYERRWRRKDGKELWTIVSAKPAFDSMGNFLGGFAMATDITGRKAIETELHELNLDLERRVRARTEELEDANTKLQELDRVKSMFIASVSHELRTPLNSIIGFSSILLKGWCGEVNKAQAEDLEVILQAGKHLHTLITDVIDISKIEAGKLDSTVDEFDLQDLVEEAMEMTKAEWARKGLEFREEVPGLLMRTDRRRLLQCVLNLLSNAAKYTVNGSVLIKAEPFRGSGAAGAPDMLELRVTDTGIGIKNEDLPKLFCPFVRVPGELTDKTRGNGLGLHLVKKLASEILKGEVFVDSQYGRGSTFGLRIPVRLKQGD